MCVCVGGGQGVCVCAWGRLVKLTFLSTDFIAHPIVPSNNACL